MGMDVFGNSGNYFRANIWSWRAICSVIGATGFEVPYDWHINDGAGLSTSEECQQLADRLDQFLNTWDGDEVSVDIGTIRVDKTGRFVDPGTPDSHSPYHATREHLQEFADFLRASDGFEIH